MVTGLGQLTLLGLFGGVAFGGGELQPATAVEVQRIRPIEADRQIELTNSSAFFARRPVIEDRLDLRLGATATHARGHIVQLEGRYEEGTLRRVVQDSPAWGLGPTVTATLRLAELGPVRLNLDASGSLMLYDRAFPSGGRRYNGMVQAGPSLSLDLSPRRSLTAGARWTHISNGQGLDAHNPGYDGRGLFVQLERKLGRGA